MRRLDLVGIRKQFFIGSGVIVLISLVMLAIPPALRPGIEFTAGTTMLVRFSGAVDQADLRVLYAELGHPEARIQSAGPGDFLIRTRELQVPEGAFTQPAPEPTPGVAPVGPVPLEPLGSVVLGAEGATGEVPLRRPFRGDVCAFGDVAGRVPAGTEAQVTGVHEECGEGDDTVYEVATDAVIGLVRAGDTHGFEPVEAEPAAEQPAEDQGERTVIEQALRERFGGFEVLEFSSVSPVVSQAAVRNAILAVVIAAIFIMGYIIFAFAGVPKPTRYATAAIVAVLHDVVIVLGVFALLGKLFGTEVNLMFVTGLLTVIGFSVHDTIVVFDRIRENVQLSPDARFSQSVNAALVQTLARSFNTSITVLLTVLALLLLGGVTIREFLLVILVGVVAGTYSSIGIAAQVLVAWEEGDFARWLRRRPAPAA
jgi:preprotein translocase SecF subunit